MSILHEMSKSRNVGGILMSEWSDNDNNYNAFIIGYLTSETHSTFTI